MQEWKQAKAVVQSIKTVTKAVKEGRAGTDALREVQISAEELNQVLYHARSLKFQGSYNLETREGEMAYIEEAERLIDLWERSIERRTGKRTDADFWELYEYFKYVDINEIYQNTLQKFMSLPEGLRIEYLALPHRYTFLKNKIDFTENDFSLIAQYVEMMANRVEDYRWLYERMEDNRSKIVLNGIIRYWFEFDLSQLRSLCETTFSDYYDMDILDCGKDDVVVDLGAYTGDSLLNYVYTYGVYKRIYAYEITPCTYQKMVQNMEGFADIIPRQKGVGSRSGEMYLAEDEPRAGNQLQESGNIAVEVVTLDEDIKEPVTVIKMDIEGAEKDAVLGAASHIQMDRPRLLISAYHVPEDIFEIPHLVDDIRNDYKFYLRFQGHGCLWPCDYVLYAV